MDLPGTWHPGGIAPCRMARMTIVRGDLVENDVGVRAALMRGSTYRFACADMGAMPTG